MFYGFVNSNAQDNDFVSITAGFLYTSTSVNTEGAIENGSDSGFYIGFLGEIYVSHEFWLQPELVYARTNDNSYLQLPILAKFYISDRMNLLAGPQISYTLDDVTDNYSKINVGVGVGVGYNITKNIILNTRYTFQINDYYTGNGDFSFKTRFFNAGLAYKFKEF